MRDLFCVPPAHVTVHGPHGFHLDQLPSPVIGNPDTLVTSHTSRNFNVQNGIAIFVVRRRGHTSSD